MSDPISMKVDLIGQLRNTAQQIRVPDRKWKEYYAGALDELVLHLEFIKENPDQLPRFLEMYCLVK